jgi:transposase
MLTQEQGVEIRVLARRGVGIREIARQVGCSRNTVRRYVKDASAARYKPRPPTATKLEAFKPYVLERIEAARPHWIPAAVLLRELQERGYPGGLTQLKAFLAPYKEVEPEPVVRFETPPGKQMQADFTVVRRGRDALLALVATLGYSRATFVQFSRREDFAALRAGLVAAFEYFGGVPDCVLFDNARTVVSERDAYGEGRHRWHSQLLALANDYGFKPAVCRPYRARTKGKVERFNGYLKGSFLVPLAATLKAGGLKLDVDTANQAVRRWLDEVANRRLHGTTGEQPVVRLAVERAALLPLPQAAVAAPAPAPHRAHALPIESLQHPLSVYQALLSGPAA